MSPPTPSNSGYIFLYNGAGANRFCVDKAESSINQYLGVEESPRLIKADSSYIVRDLSRSGQAVVFTGGNASHTRLDFKEAGIKHLSEAILIHGRTFVGFCSGAYLAGEFTYHYEGTRFLRANYGLSLIDLEHKGPAYSLGEDAEHLGTKTSRAARVTFGSLPKTGHVFWNGGGAYGDHNPSMFVKFATYEQESFQRFGNNAGLYTRQGRGNVVCTSLHPEIQLDRDDVQMWCPAISEEERALLVRDVPIQKEFLAEVCNLGNITGQSPRHWTTYYA